MKQDSMKPGVKALCKLAATLAALELVACSDGAESLETGEVAQAATLAVQTAGVGTLTFSSCTALQQADIISAHTTAYRATNIAYDALRNSTTADQQSSRWYRDLFGAFDSTRYNRVRD